MKKSDATTTAYKLPAGITSRSMSYNVDPSRITFRDGWNNRFDMGDIEGLAQGIRSTAERHPDRPFADNIGLRRIPKTDPRSADYDFEVESGHRRTLAAQWLIKQGFVFPKGVNANLIDKDQSELDSLIDMFNENNKKPLLPLEEAAAFKRLRDTQDPAYPKGMSIQQICAVTGRAHMHVQAMLALLDADVALHEAVKAGKVTTTAAKEIATVARGDKLRQRELTQHASKATDKKGRRELKDQLHAARASKAAQKGKQLKMRALSDEQLAELGEKVLKALKLAIQADGTFHAKVRKANTDKDLEIMVDDVLSKPEHAVGFYLGSLMALKAAAGQKVDLGA